MIWYKYLQIGNSILKKSNKIKWKIEHNVLCPNVYMITLAANEKDLLDIIPSRELLQKAYPKKNLSVVGLAGGYEESLELVAKFCNQVLEETGSLDLRAYITQKKE